MLYNNYFIFFAGLSPLDPASCNLHLSHLDGTGNSQSSPPLSSGGGQRTKRMRTSFKHHQLRTMKSYFAINQNPDAKDLKQLAQKTGLSKRVLQVINTLTAINKVFQKQSFSEDHFCFEKSYKQ